MADDGPEGGLVEETGALSMVSGGTRRSFPLRAASRSRRRNIANSRLIVAGATRREPSTSFPSRLTGTFWPWRFTT
jgi:hypothetical protein